MPKKFSSDYQPSRRKSGKSEKVKQWEILGEYMANEGAAKALEILAASPDPVYLNNFLKLLNYFKPQLQRQDVTSSDGSMSPQNKKIIVEYVNISGDTK